MYMSELWRDELLNVEKGELKRKSFKLPAIVPIVIYNGKYNWTAARNFKEVLNGYELFEDNIIDFKYLLYDINRMDKEELFKIATVISSVFSLDQSDVTPEEIINRLEFVGRVLKRKSSEEQIKIFYRWVAGILKNRYAENVGNEIIDILNNASDVEVENMVSNLKKNLEKGFEQKEEQGRKEGEKEVAINLLEMGMDIDAIIKATGLDRNTIEDLKKSKSN